MDNSLAVKDIMSKEVIFVYPETPILQAQEIISKHNFDGVPVVDKNNYLVGILTEYDLLSKSSGVHLPTLQKLFSELPVYKKDYKDFKKEIDELSQITVKEVMNTDPLTVSENAPLQEMVELFREHHRVNPIPVIDKDRKVVGVVSRFDAVKLFYVVKMTKP